MAARPAPSRVGLLSSSRRARCICSRQPRSVTRRQSLQVHASSSSASSSGSSDAVPLVFLSNGDVISWPSKRGTYMPSLQYSREQAVALQLQALYENNQPYPDHGIEVLYRFADFDPFARSDYFGRSLDLGQFERFRRIMHTPYYAPLLGFVEHTLLSSFEVSETIWKQRVRVMAPWKEERTYEFTMAQRFGGIYDGYWFTSSLICDEADWSEIRITGV